MKTPKSQESDQEGAISSPFEKTPELYTPVLPYDELLGLACENKSTAPAYMQASMEEVVESLRYAAQKVADGTICDRDSERSHFKNVWMTVDYADNAQRPGEPDAAYWFLAALARPLVEAWDVLEDGDDPREKKYLYNAAAQSIKDTLSILSTHQEQINKWEKKTFPDLRREYGNSPHPT